MFVKTINKCHRLRAGCSVSEQVSELVIQ